MSEISKQNERQSYITLLNILHRHISDFDVLEVRVNVYFASSSFFSSFKISACVTRELSRTISLGSRETEKESERKKKRVKKREFCFTVSLSV